jgi:hypothetical protein
MKLLIPVLAGLSATVNSKALVIKGCNIKCPNGMTAKVGLWPNTYDLGAYGSWGCNKGGDHRPYHEALDLAIKKACFREIDTKLSQGKISSEDAGYWKAIWTHVEEQDDFGCSNDGFWLNYDDNTHDGCRLHDICYTTYRRYEEETGKTYTVTVNYLVDKTKCDDDQHDNHEVLGSGGDIIRYFHSANWFYISSNAFIAAFKEGKDFYDNQKHKFSTSISSDISSFKTYVRD